MSEKRSANERKKKSIAECISKAKKLLKRAADALIREPEHLSATQLVKLMDKIYKTQQILTQLEDESDKLLRKLLNRDDDKR